MQIIFLSGTKCLRLPQYVNKFLVWHKNFGPAQNILGPVKGQGISQLCGKQGTYFHLLSSALMGAPLPPPLRRRRLWMAPYMNNNFYFQHSFS